MAQSAAFLKALRRKYRLGEFKTGSTTRRNTYGKGFAFFLRDKSLFG